LIEAALAVCSRRRVAVARRPPVPYPAGLRPVAAASPSSRTVRRTTGLSRRVRAAAQRLRDFFFQLDGRSFSQSVLFGAIVQRY